MCVTQHPENPKGLDGAGAASIVMQWVCLALAVVPQIWTVLFRQAPLPSLLTSSMLIGAFNVYPVLLPNTSLLTLSTNRCAPGGLVASRFGLWAFDLAVSQTMQEQVPNEILGQVNGVQGALQQGGELTMFLLGVAMPRPEQYPVLMLVSFAFVTLALFVFERWALFGSDKEQRALRGMQYQRLESA